LPNDALNKKKQKKLSYGLMNIWSGIDQCCKAVGATDGLLVNATKQLHLDARRAWNEHIKPLKRNRRRFDDISLSQSLMKRMILFLIGIKQKHRKRYTVHQLEKRHLL
jgi:hypothetical protein